MTPASQLALSGGSPAVTLDKPEWPVRSEEDALTVADIIRSGKWSWIGPHEMAFCKEYAEFIGTKQCLGLSNGTVTLQCALQAVGVEPGDEVIVPGMTWVATAQAAMDIGANVVLVDIDPETICIDPAAFEAAITPKTKAVIPVHLYGCMCDMDAVMDVARTHGVKVVEDVAHQQGSKWRDTMAGAIGDAGSYSFQQSKALTSGEGGAVTTNDDEVYQTCFALKQVGWMPDPENPAPPGEAPKLVPGNRYGHNYRITEMQAALLRAGLARLPEQTERRERNVQAIAAQLHDMGGPLRAAKRDPRVAQQAYYCMTLHFDPERADGLTRRQYAAALQAEGFPAGGTYEPVYRSKLLNLYDRTSPIPYRDPDAVQDYANLRLPNVERAAETAVLLSHPLLLGSEAFTNQLVAAVAKVNDNLPAVRRHFASLEDEEN